MPRRPTPGHRKSTMNRTTSSYLDLMRIATAVTVFLVHANYGRFTGGLPVICYLKFLANDGVMVFFVLSGFVIAYVADGKETSGRDYAVSRLARLYSVALPAVGLTMVLDYLGSSVNYTLYDGWWFQADNPLWRISASLLFINELWFSSVRLFSNGPFWSLGYEFWYYVIFGAAFYLEGRLRLFAVATAMLIAGPKILLLFPVWLLGVLTYRTVKAAVVPEHWGWVLCLGSVAGYVLFQKLDLSRVLLAWSAANLDGVFFWSTLKWSYATPFLSDYAVGALAALHLIGFAAVSHRFAGLFRMIGPGIHRLAGFSFSIYLFHYPLLQFLSAVLGVVPDPSWRSAAIVFGTLGLIYPLGLVTEMKKAAFKRAILHVWAALRRLPVLHPQE